MAKSSSKDGNCLVAAMRRLLGGRIRPKKISIFVSALFGRFRLRGFRTGSVSHVQLVYRPATPVSRAPGPSQQMRVETLNSFRTPTAVSALLWSPPSVYRFQRRGRSTVTTFPPFL